MPFALPQRKIKVFKGTLRAQIARRDTGKLLHGDIGLQALESGNLSDKSMETIRKILATNMKTIGSIHWNVKPTLARTRKPLQARMGAGKGDVDHYVAPCPKGTILFECSNFDTKQGHKVLRLVKTKLRIRTRIVTRKDQLPIHV